MKCVIVLLLCTLVVLLKTRPGEAQSRIVAGHLVQESDRHNISFLVSLQYHNPNPVTALSGYPHVCQGTLVDANWIVTAAHCFSSQTFEGLQNLEDWTAVAGEYDLNVTDGVEQTRNITHVFQHPDFNITTIEVASEQIQKPFSDIALLKVDSPFILNDNISFLTYDPYCVNESAQCFIYGWGAPAYGAPARRYPYEGAVPMPGPNNCHEKYDHLNPIIAAGAVFCTQGTPQNNVTLVTDACQADSGGPCVCRCGGQSQRLVLTGIVSSGILCGYPGLPGIYTSLKVRRIFDFIWNTINQNS